MAQLFDSTTIAGVDNNTYHLAVQSLIDSQTINDAPQPPPQSSDEDVFQCGKCKRQFNSLSLFVGHKQQACGANNSTTSQSAPQQFQHIYTTQHVNTVQQLSAHNAAFNQLPTNIVIPEDMMTLTLDSNSGGALHLQQGGGAQGSPFLSSAQMSMNNCKRLSSAPAPSVSATRQIQLHPVTVVSSQTGAALVPSQGQPGNVISASVDAASSSAIAVLLDDPSQNLQPRSSYTNGEQPGALPAEGSTIQWEVAPQVEPPQEKAKKRSKRTLPKQHLSCDWCKKTFQKNFDLEQHKRAHTGEKPFQCVVCGRAFSQKSNVKKHMQTHKVWPLGSHNALPEQPAPQLMVVQERDLRAASKNTANEREGKDTSSSQPEQSQDNQESAVLEDDIASMKWHFLVDSSYVCPYCPNAQTRFDTYYQLKSHLVTHKTEQLFKCVLRNCDKTFEELDEFLEHTKMHESQGEMSYHCHVCNTQFPTLDELGTHQYTHSIDPNTGLSDNRRKKSEWKWRCLQCGNVYTSPEALQHHVTTTSHNHPCPQCSKVYPSPRLLRRHLTIHKPSEEREFSCDICQKSMKSEYYLKAHKRIHTGELPFACELCGKRFNRKDKVNRHMLTHDPVKKFVCPFKDISGCEKAFARPDKLKDHIRQHKKISVDTVTKISRNATSSSGTVTLLTKHKGPLSQPDPMTCKHCQNCRFETSLELATHEMLCSQIPKMKCKRCELTFNTEENYALHECKPATETVLISHVNSVKVNHTNRRSKRRKVNRIELSPPPVRRTKRSQRTRLANVSDQEKDISVMISDSGAEAT